MGAWRRDADIETVKPAPHWQKHGDGLSGVPESNVLNQILHALDNMRAGRDAMEVRRGMRSRTAPLCDQLVTRP
jgi:hypothetical protein